MTRTNRILAIAGGVLAVGLAFPGAAQAAPIAALCDGKVPTILTKPGVATFGTDGNDVILGTEGPDEIHAVGGNDTVCSLGGDDRVGAGPGNDRIFGGDGNDELRNGQGNDTLFGGNGDDTLELRDGGNIGDIGHGDAGFDTAIVDVNPNGGRDLVFTVEKVESL